MLYLRFIYEFEPSRKATKILKGFDMGPKTYTEQSLDGDVSGALREAVAAAKKGVQAHLMEWKLESIHGDTGGIVGDTVVVTISAGAKGVFGEQIASLTNNPQDPTDVLDKGRNGGDDNFD